MTATIGSATWKGIKLKKIEERVAQDIENNKMWKVIYIFMITLFPELLVLRFDDSNQDCVDKLYYMCHRITHDVMKSSTSLNDRYFLPSPEADNDSDGFQFDTSDENDDDDENDVNDNIEEEKVTS